MDHLPACLILKILKYLPIRNQIELRVVSKQFKEIIDYRIPNELILIGKQFIIDYCDLFENTNLNCLIVIKDLKLFSNTNLLNFNKIKKLKSFLCLNVNLANQFYNSFKELIEFHYSGSTYKYGDIIKLKLKKLKILNVDYKEVIVPNYFKLYTPSLTELIIYSLRNIFTIHYVKLLKLRLHTISDHEISKLFKFKNLEQLEIIGNYYSNINFNNRLLERLTNLKKFILFDEGLIRNYNNPDTKPLDVIRIQNKIDQINNLTYRRENLEIIIYGLGIDQFKSILPNYSFDLCLKFIIENPIEVNIMKFVSIDYVQLMELVNYELPNDFYTKIYWNWIEINQKIDDELKLIDFIKKSNAKKLDISVKLSNSFFNKLFDDNVSIYSIRFRGNCKIDFIDNNFIDIICKLKIRSLSFSLYYYSSPLELLIKLINNNVSDYCYIDLFKAKRKKNGICRLEKTFFVEVKEMAYKCKILRYRDHYESKYKPRSEIIKFLEFANKNIQKKLNYDKLVHLAEYFLK